MTAIDGNRREDVYTKWCLWNSMCVQLARSVKKFPFTHFTQICALGFLTDNFVWGDAFQSNLVMQRDYQHVWVIGNFDAKTYRSSFQCGRLTCWLSRWPSASRASKTVEDGYKETWLSRNIRVYNSATQELRYEAINTRTTDECKPKEALRISKNMLP